MEFPKFLDDEDMDLAIKEWKLSGCPVLAGKDPHNGFPYVDIRDPDEELGEAPDAKGAYIQRGDGYWILVPHDNYPRWKEAMAYAEAHDVGT